MLRLSRLADYAVVVMLRLADASAIETSNGIAAAIGIPEPTVAKVLKMLAAAGLAGSLRGARGGYRVARPLSDVSIAEVIAAVDGPIALTSCVDGAASVCEVSRQCALRGRWDLVNDAIRGALESISLADLRAGPPRARLRPLVDQATQAVPAE